MSCPVTTRYLERVKQLSVRFNKELYEDEFEGLLDLFELAQVCDGESANLRLRGFFCVDVMCCLCLRPKALRLQYASQLPTLSEEAEEFLTTALETPLVDTSWSGLTERLKGLKEVEEGIEVLMTEFNLMGIDMSTVDALDDESARGLLKLVKVCVAASARLRASLKATPVDIAAVGADLGVAVNLANWSLRRQLVVGQNIMRVTLDSNVDVRSFTSSLLTAEMSI